MSNKKDKYEVVIPERRYIVIGLEEAGRVLKQHQQVGGVSIKLIKNEEDKNAKNN